MSVVSVQAKSFILALFIRDDGERFLLGDNGYEFKDGQLHFNANDIENDEVAKQGADGVMLAGQVRRSSVQEFEGYVGDATDAKDTIEDKRKAFIAFFASGHHFRVVYVDCNSNAWQRKGGYLVDAPEVKELWQIHPEYHVGLNFEDVNYYSYNEDAEGDEILANYLNVPVSSDVSGGLEWDSDGAVSEDATVEYDTETKTATKGKVVSFSDGISAPIADIQIDGETSQNGTPTPSAPVPVQTVTGENVVKICGKNLLNLNSFVKGRLDNGVLGYASNTTALSVDGDSISFTTNANYRGITTGYIAVEPGGTYSTNIPTTGLYGADIAQYDNSMNFISQGSLSPEQTYGNTTHYIRIYLFLRNSGSATLDSLQLELGSATAYEPYQEQSYEVNLGKNLLDSSSYEDAYISNTGVKTTGGGLNALFGYISVSPSTSYTISASSSTRFSAAFYNGETYISRDANHDGTSYTFTTPNNCNRIRCWVYNYEGITQSYIDSLNLQLELGSQATSYAAYFEPIELCGLGDDGAGGYLYQNYIWNDNGTWKKHKAINKAVLNGSEDSWHIEQSGMAGYFYRCNLSQGTSVSENIYALCSNYGVAGNVRLTTTNEGIAIFNNNHLRIRYGAEMSLDNWKAKLSATNMTLYYPITPTDTEITNQALIAQLDALAEANIYDGTNNIFAVTPNEQPSLEVDYYTKYIVNVTAGGYVWEEGGSGGPTTVINDSISNVAPVWTVYGPTVNPVLENTTTGEEIEYVGTIADGQTLVIDMGEQTALLNGLNVIGNVTGDYVSLAPGQNTLLYSTSSGDTDSEIGWSEIVG